MDTGTGLPALPPTASVATSLDAWTVHDWSGGIHIPRCQPSDRFVIRTRNSTYDMVVVEPHTSSVLIRGGAFFPVFTRVHVAGSSLGGSCLKLHGIHPGFQLELATDDLPIVTTRVRTVSRMNDASDQVM